MLLPLLCFLDRKMNTSPEYCSAYVVILVSSLLSEFDGLPPWPQCVTYANTGQAYVNDLQKWKQLYFRDEKLHRINEAYYEAHSLTCWWRGAENAMNPNHTFEERLHDVRVLRAHFNWQIYGLPPMLPYWRLPRP